MPAHWKAARARRALIVLIAVSLVVSLIPLRAIPAQATGYSGTILADSPIAYWRLGETSGTAAADATGHGNTGTYTGAAGTYTLGQPGALFGDADTATKLDGQAGHVVVPNSTGLQTNQVSIELWIKKLTETPWGTYISKNITNGGGSGTGWFQLLNYGATGRLQFRVTGEDAASSLQSSSTLLLNTWYYVVATYDGTTARLFVNGNTDSSMALTATPAQTTDPLYIGRRPDGYYTNAVLDEVAVYPSALTAAQVSNHWLASANPPGSPTSVTTTAPAGNQARVTWVDPVSGGATTITGYTITPHIATTSRTPVTVTGATTTTALLTGLSAGTYTFTVVANNANGSSPPSAASSNLTVTGSTYGYAATILGDSPAAYYRLGDATGITASDATANANSGTYFGNRTQGQAGALSASDPDQAVTFDGSTAYVVAPSTTVLKSNTISIELWLKKVAQTAYGAYVTKNFAPGGGAGTGWFELLNNNVTGKLQFRVTGDTADVSLNSAATLALNTWYDVVATYDGATAKMYVNGALDSSMALTATPSQTSEPLYIGKRSDGYFNNALMDEVALYPSPLSAAQVARHWQAGGYVPGTPTGVSAVHGTANKATVSWTAPSYAGASAISGYTVLTTGGPTQIAPFSATASPATIGGLSGGQSYTFTVTAKNSYGSGAASSASGAVIPTGNAVPTVPTTLSATPGNLQATVSWHAPTSNGGSSITGYTVTPYVGTTAGTPKSVGASTLSTTITSLLNGTSYTFQVYASNAVGPGPAAATSAVTPAAVPGAPTNVAATAGNAQATVSWSAPSNGGSVITNYSVQPFIGSSGQTVTNVSGSTTSTIITGLANGTAYTFKVTATNAIGAGAASAASTPAVTPTGVGPSVPGPPSNVVAQIANGSSVVSWTAPNNGGAAITGYTLTPYVGTVAGPSTPASASPATVPNLTNGTAYVIYVTATNSVGVGPAGTSNIVIPAAVPGTPSAVNAVGGNAQATVSWTAPPSNGGTIQTYTVTSYVGNTAFSALTVTGGVTNVTMTGLTNGTTYTFTVSGMNSAGSSPVGTSSAVTPATTPDAPSNVAASSGNASATVSWSVPSGNGSAISTYTVTPFVGSTPGTPTQVATNSATITSLTNGTTYTFQVTATNAIGTGVAGVSNSVTVGTTLPPTGVSGVSTSANQATVSWSAASGASGYVVTAYVGSQPTNSVATGVTTSASLTGLSSGNYTFRVVALNTFGTSLASTASGSVTVSGAATTYASTIQADGPSIYYRLGETSGLVAADSSGNGRTGGYGGAFTQGVAGGLPSDGDAAVSLAGGSVRQSIPGPGLPTGNAPRSLEAWVKTTSIGPIVMYGSGGSNNLFDLKLTGNSVGLVGYNNDHWFTTPYSIANGAWHAVVVTYDGAGILTMYLDGNSLGTQSLGAPLATVPDGNGLLIGNDYWASLTASVDEVAIYPKALTAAQVLNHFSASGNTRPTAPTGVTASSTVGNQASVSWTASTASPGAPVTAYVVTAFVGSQAQTSLGVSGTSTSATITGLKGGTAYTFQVMAINNFGNGPWSAASTAVTPTGTATTYASTIQADSPSIYYRLDESSGTVAADSSGTGRPAGYRGSYALGAAGPLVNDSDPGVSLSGGAAGQISAGPGLPTANAPRSLEAWVKTTSSGPIVMYGSGGTNNLFDLKVSGNSIGLVGYNNDHWFTTPYSVANGTWHLVVVTYDGAGSLTMFLDGTSVGSQSVGGTLNTVPDANGLLIGNDYWASLTASVDEVAVYSKALTAAQVLNHFSASGNSRPTAPTAVTASSTLGNQASVSWTASTTSPGAPVTAYVVTAFAGTQAQTSIAVNGTSTTATVTGLKGGTAYTFQVLAMNNFGNGPWSAASAAVTPTGTATTYASTIQADGPSIYYRLDEGTGTVAADSSGNGRPAGYRGSYTFGAAGALVNDSDPGVSLAGGSVGQISAGPGLPTANAPRSLEAWVKTTGTGPIVMYGSGGTSALFDLKLTGNSLGLVGYNNDHWFATPYSIANGTWHDVVVTYDGAGNLTMYLDGTSLGSQTVAGTLTTVPDANGLLIGTDYWGSLTGSVDEVAVYPKALTPAQVLNHFAASGNSKPTAPTNVSVTPGANQLTVTWNPSLTSPGAPVTQYIATGLAGSQRQSVGVAGSATSTTITGLKGGVSYTFQVQAFSVFGSSPLSAASSPTAATGGSTYASMVLADGPAAYYRLDDSGGTVAGETSGNSPNGSYAGGYTLSQPGALPSDTDASVALDGISGYVLGPSSAALQNTNKVSIELWLKKVTDVPGGMYVTKNWASCGGAGTGWFQLMNNAGHLQFRVTGDCGTSFDSIATLSVNSWYHVVATYDGQTAKIYVNGTLDSTYSITATPVQTSDPLYIGRRSDGGYNNALIDDVAIYPYALTDSQIGAHFTASGNAALPAAPGSVSAVGGSAQATVSWTTPSANGGTISNYTVTPYIGTTAGTPVSVPAPANNTTVTGLVDSTTYTFQVTATSNVGTGQPGTSSAVTVGAPGVPTSVTAQSGNTQASVSWTAPASNSSSITSYTVTPFIGSSGGTPTVINGTPPPPNATVTGLTNGTTYTFQVAASNAQGTSPAGVSPPMMVGMPSAPGNVSATIPGTNNQATVSWTAATANGLSITGYLVTAYLGAQPVNAQALGTSATSATITGLQGGTGYNFQVAAITSAGAGPAGVSAVVTPTGPGSTYASTVLGDGPAAYYRFGDPSGTTAADSSGAAVNGTYAGGYTLGQAGGLSNDSDTAVSFDGSSGYVVAPSSTALQNTNKVTIELWLKKITDTGYGMYVTKNFAGNGGPGSGWYQLMNNSGHLEFRVTGDSGASMDSIATLATNQWYYAVATYDGTTAKLYINGALDSTYAITTTPTQSTAPLYIGRRTDGYYNNAVIDDVAIYPYALTAAQIAIHGSASGMVPPSPPTAPTPVNATAGANQATVTWSAPPGSISRYVVTTYQGSQPQNSMVVAGSTTTSVISGLQAGTAYTFQVVAYNSVGGSPPGISGAVTPTGASSTYAATVLGDGPLAYYRLDDGVGVGADSSGSGQTASFNGTYTLGSAGGLANDADKALYLNGGYVQAPATLLPSGNAARTLEAWVNLSGTGGSGSQTLMGYGTSAGTRTLFEVQLQGSSTIMVASGGDNRYFTLPYAITNGNWHQVVATYDGSILTLYLDGQSVGTASFSDRLGTLADGNGLILGRDTPGSGNWVTGSLDEAAVYATALTATQVLNHFNASGWSRPVAPTGVTATAGANQATVNWTAPGGTVTGYLVTALAGNVAQNSVALGSVTSTTVTGLAVGTAYSFQVQAMNNFGSGPTAASSAVTISAGSNPAFAATVLTDGPVAYYRLGDSGGTLAADSSGGGKQGTYSGTYTLGQAGGLLNDSEKSVYLNGGTMTAPDAFMPMGNNARTIEAWVNVPSVGGGTQGVAGYGTSSTRSLFDLRLTSTNQVAVVTSSDDHTFTAGYQLTNGVWHQLAATYDGTTLVVYVDGQSIGQTTLAGALGTQSNGSGLMIGRDSWVTADWLSGNVQDVSVYAKALTSTQVANHWAAAGYRRPSAPINPIASAGPQGAIVSWTVPTDLGNPPLTGYTITPFAGSTAGTPVSVGPNLTNVTMSGLPPQTAYTFQVKANSVYDPPVANSGAITTALALTPVPANSAYVLEVGYLDTWHPFQNFTPNPWSGSPNTTFIGNTGSTEGGALRIHDLTGSGLTLNDISVDIGIYHFANVWGTNLAVPAGGDLILAPTSVGNSNFDTSDAPVTCTQDGFIPIVHATVNGVHVDWRDSGQILNTGGIDTGSGGCGIGEGHDWSIVHNGPLPSEIMGPNGSMKICWTCMGLPVNTASGDFWHTFTDFDIPGRGFNLHFDRTYNSQAAPFDGPLGYGWSDPYNLFLSFDAASGTVGVHQEAGSTVPFTLNGTTYTPGVGVLASLVRNGDGTFTFQRTDLARYVFNGRGELLSETDRNGYATTFNYTNDQLATVTEPAGRTLTFVYTGNHITRINDTAGSRNVTLTYDALGNLTKAADVGGASTTFAYDASHLMLAMTDPNGGTATNVYDSSGRVTRQTDAMNRLTQFAYTPGKTTVTDPNGNQTVDIYQNGELIQETKAFGTLQAATWYHSYDQVSLGIASVTDPNGHTTTNTWDANGNLLSKTDPLAQTTRYTYNGFNELLTLADPLGVTTTNTYDATGNLTKTYAPLTGTTQYAVTTYAYDTGHPGDVTRMTDANGKSWQYAYDANGLRNSVIDPVGDKTTYSYDPVGRLQSTVSPKGNVQGGNPSAYTTSFSFNAYGDRLSAVDPLNDLASYKYDANRNRTVVIDGNNRSASFAYDADNEVVQEVRSDGSTLKTLYDNNGNVIQQIDGLGNSTAYQYNALSERTKMTDPLTRSTQYGFDGVGNLLTVQNPKDASVSYTMTYDAADQLKTITYSDGTTPNVSYQYDADGQRTQMVDGSGTTTYAFDSLHRLTQDTNGSGAQVQYGYDLLGHVNKLVYPGAATVSRAYDDAGRLTSVTDWLNNSTRFTYDPDGNLLSQTYPNGAVASYTYDAADRLMQIVDVANGSQLFNLTYTRDGRNDLTAENTTLYAYDANSRVTSAATGGSSRSYAYDAGDNITKIPSGSNSTTQVYDAANQVQTATTMNGPTQVQKYTYAYDLNGQRLTRTDQNAMVTSYGWDQAKRLTSYGTTANYSYDGDGLRVSKTVSGTTSQISWDLAEGLPLILKDGPIAYVTGPGGLPLAQINGSTATYYHLDQLGNARALTNATGGTVATYSFDPFGNVLGTPPSFTNPFQFAGQYSDSESGLVFMRGRYYDPTNGLFISRDPLLMTTREAYAYVQDNPLNATDPTGMACWAFWDPKQCDNMLTSAMKEFEGTHGNPKAIASVIYTHTVVSYSGCLGICASAQFQGGVVSANIGCCGGLARGPGIGWAEKRPQDRCDSNFGIGGALIGGVQASVGMTKQGGMDKGDSEIDVFPGTGGWVGRNWTVFTWEPGDHNKVRGPLFETGFK